MSRDNNYIYLDDFREYFAVYKKKLIAFWFKPVDAVRLDTFQRCFSVAFLLYMLERFYYAREWLTSYGFHLTMETKLWFHPTPWPLLPGWLLPVFGLMLFGSTLALICGWNTRKMVWVVLFCAVYVQLADIVSAFTINKFFIVGYAVLALAPRPQSITLGDSKATKIYQSAWPIRVLQATLLISYGTAGFCKIIHGDWLSNPDVLWSQVQGVYATDIAAWMLRVVPKPIWTLMMYSSLAFEATAPVLFSIRKFRKIGMIWGVAFQLIIALTMHQLIYFSLQLLCFYILFFNADTLISCKTFLKRTIVQYLRKCIQLLEPST